jgi:hypothetical protein
MQTFATGISTIALTGLTCHRPNEFGKRISVHFPGKQGMSDQQNSKRVVDLSEYRAARAALKAQAVTQPSYLLWYPGLGYVQVNPAVAAVAPSGVPVGRNHPRF